MEPSPRPWYKKKRYLIPIGALILLIVISVNSGNQSSTTAADTQDTGTVAPSDVSNSDAQGAATPSDVDDASDDSPDVDATNDDSSDSDSVDTSDSDSDSDINAGDDSDSDTNSDDSDSAAISGDSTYTNSDDNQVPSPLPLNNCAADGGSAICNDGSCSFSAHRSGTCSDHGGVEEWL